MKKKVIQIGCEGCCVNIKINYDELPLKLKKFLDKHEYENIKFLSEKEGVGKTKW